MVAGERKWLLLRFLLLVSVLLLAGRTGWHFPAVSVEKVWAEPFPGSGVKLKGTVARGREIFNGMGGCYVCHGIDGYIGRTPRLEPNVALFVAKLDPPPSDLRNPAGLRLKTNQERRGLIREGHPRGGPLGPAPAMTDQDLADLFMYLAFLRKDPNPESE